MKIIMMTLRAHFGVAMLPCLAFPITVNPPLSRLRVLNMTIEPHLMTSDLPS